MAAVQLWVLVLGKAFNFLSISKRKYKSGKSIIKLDSLSSGV